PSIYEGYGMPITEAQYCGAAVIHGNHASMVEASSGFGYAFDPTRAGIREMLLNYARHELPLSCRRTNDIDRTPMPAAQMLWNVMCDAYSADRAGKRS
ncbi:MAG: hypothetical protein WA183_01875, partial [Chthoniobacterales bacterium]